MKCNKILAVILIMIFSLTACASTTDQISDSSSTNADEVKDYVAERLDAEWEESAGGSSIATVEKNGDKYDIIIIVTGYSDELINTVDGCGLLVTVILSNVETNYKEDYELTGNIRFAFNTSDSLLIVFETDIDHDIFSYENEFNVTEYMNGTEIGTSTYKMTK
jgi:hypothetical protein